MRWKEELGLRLAVEETLERPNPPFRYQTVATLAAPNVRSRRVRPGPPFPLESAILGLEIAIDSRSKKGKPRSV